MQRLDGHADRVEELACHHAKPYRLLKKLSRVERQFDHIKYDLSHRLNNTPFYNLGHDVQHDCQLCELLTRIARTINCLEDTVRLLLYVSYSRHRLNRFSAYATGHGKSGFVLRLRGFHIRL